MQLLRMSLVQKNRNLFAYLANQPLAVHRLMMRNVLGIGVGGEEKPKSPALSTPKLRFIQFLRNHDKRKRLGVVSEDGTSLVELSGGSCISNDFIKFLHQGISVHELLSKIEHMQPEPVHDRLTLLPPITNPGKIICVALNYHDHIKEQNKKTPEEPIFFTKYNNTLIGPRQNVIAHKITNKIDWEVELAVVIGKECCNITRDQAMDYVFGYTVAQDITARDWQKRNGGQFLIGKSMDTFCPLGPSIVHKSIITNPHDLYLKCSVNGVQKQKGNTSKMIFKIDELICRLSQYMTLAPGDVILTGTPAGVGMYRTPPEYLKEGDIIESEIQCVGKLCNNVVAAS